jgi:cellobiose-specific phosphotransferase system component IIC
MVQMAQNNFQDICQNVSAHPEVDCAKLDTATHAVAPVIQIAAAAIMVGLIIGIVVALIWRGRRARSALQLPTEVPPPELLKLDQK